MLVSPYFYSNPSDPDVHHRHSDCPSGQQIPERNKQPAQTTTGFVSTAGCSAPLTLAVVSAIP